MPRSELDRAAARDAGTRVGACFLVGETEDEAGTPVAYVGEAENCYERLDSHHRRRDFWKYRHHRHVQDTKLHKSPRPPSPRFQAIS